MTFKLNTLFKRVKRYKIFHTKSTSVLVQNYLCGDGFGFGIFPSNA